MFETLDTLVEHLTRIEILVAEADEWLEHYVALSTRKNLLSSFGATEEAVELAKDLAQKSKEAEGVFKGVKSELSDLTGTTSVEEARVTCISVRGLLKEVSARLSEELVPAHDRLTNEELLEQAQMLLFGRKSDD